MAGPTLSTRKPRTVVLELPAVSLMVTVNVLFADPVRQAEALKGKTTVLLFTVFVVEESQLETNKILSTLAPTPPTPLDPNNVLPTADVMLMLLLVTLTVCSKTTLLPQVSVTIMSAMCVPFVNVHNVSDSTVKEPFLCLSTLSKPAAVVKIADVLQEL